MRSLTLILALALVGFTFAPSGALAFVPAPLGAAAAGLPAWEKPSPKPKAKLRRVKPTPSPVVATPTPVVVAPPAYASGSIENMICSFDWDCGTAVAVARCESGLNPAAANGRFFGIFQLGDTERATYGAGSSLDPAIQIAAAYRLYQARSWEPWACA